MVRIATAVMSSSWRLVQNLSSVTRIFNNLLWRIPSHSRPLKSLFAPVRTISTTVPVRGLEEFFPSTDDFVEEADRAGREWMASDLRQKSSDDLHKLWYVLLKERNMLLTLEHEANKFRYVVPAPDRMRKVKKSMARIKHVLHERRIAVVEAKMKLGLISDPEAQELRMTEERRKKYRKLREKEEHDNKFTKIRIS